MIATSRSSAKLLGLTQYFTGKPCPYGHVCNRMTCNGKCIQCKREGVKKWRSRDRERFQNHRARYREKNSDRISYVKHLWYNKNKSVINKKNLDRRRNNINYRLSFMLRKRIRQNIKSGCSHRYLGCSIEQFKVYVENQFQDEMSWGNWSFIGWHLDHIHPLASFDLSSEIQRKIAFHYTNYQPLWAKDNLSKGSKIKPVVRYCHPSFLTRLDTATRQVLTSTQRGIHAQKSSRT